MELHCRGRSALGRARNAVHSSWAAWSPQPARSGLPEERIPQVAPRARLCSRDKAVKGLPPGRAGWTLFFKCAPREPEAVQLCVDLLPTDYFSNAWEDCNIWVPRSPLMRPRSSPLRIRLCLRVSSNLIDLTGEHLPNLRVSPELIMFGNPTLVY